MAKPLSLKGKRIVITRSAEGSEPWVKYIKEQGGIAYSFPTIEIIPTKIKNRLKNVADFDWVVFTSAAGVRAFKKLAGINISRAPMPNIAVIGNATAKAARAMGYRVAFQPSTPSTAALAFELEPVRGRSILLLRSSLAANDLPKVLAERGGRVTNLAIYKTVLRRDPDPKFEKLLEGGYIDFLTFASPSAVRGFFQRLRFQKKLIKQAQTLPTIAIGPSVAAALSKSGFKDIHTAKTSNIKEMLVAAGNAI